MELHHGLSREIFAVLQAERLSEAVHERRAAEAWLGEGRSRSGTLRGWMARVAAITFRARQPRPRIQGSSSAGMPAHPW